MLDDDPPASAATRANLDVRLQPRRRWPWVVALLALALVGAARFVRPWMLTAFRFRTPPEVLTVPVQDVRRADLVSTWHAARPGGRRHKGTDIFAPRGTPVRSATHGVVWKVGWDRLGGRVVTVLGEGPAFYYYAHLESWADGLREGQEVRAGQVLGKVGNSGNAATTPPHLHFGVYRVRGWNIGAVDPVPLLARTRNPFGE